jgi:hypothetical protein
MHLTKMGIVAAMLASAISVTTSCSKDEKETKIEIRLTDNPVAVDEVNVDIREVRVKFSDDTAAANGWVSLSTNAGVYNLLGLQNGVDTLLASGNLPQNTVKQIRFVLGPNNSVTENGISYPLIIPSGSESGLKIKVSRKLNATLNTLVIDFDAALSLKKEGAGDYKLRPVLKIK